MINSAVRFVAFRDFVDPQIKLTPEWTLKTVQDLYMYGGARSLLHGKDVVDIQKLAAGAHDTEEFKDLFKGMRKTGRHEGRAALQERQGQVLRDKMVNTRGIDFEPLGILQQPLQAALSVLQKQLTYVQARAIDGMAQKKRSKDLDKLRNRPYFEAQLREISGALGVPLQAPGPEHSASGVDIATLDLDPARPDELNIYADLFYKLRPESAIETVLYSLMHLNDFKKKNDLERRDQIYYGVSASRTYFSTITGLPQYDYLFPGDVYAPNSLLPDFADVPFLYVEQRYDAEKILNEFGDTGISEEAVIGIHNDYWASRGTGFQWDTASEQDKRAGIPVIYMEFKTFDVVRVQRRRTRSGRQYNAVVPFDFKLNSKKSDPNDTVENKYPQMTYYAYWVPGTTHILKCGKLEGSFREKGRESLSSFSINIFRSKEKSDVELCRTIVKDAQRAYTKMQHAIVMAKPRGTYVDLKFIRRAAEQLKDEGGGFSVQALLTLFAQDNIMIGDSEDMDGAQDGNFKPFMEIQGGLGSEIREYLEVIRDCNERIARITGINDALTGQAPNPDGLVGLQKLLLQSSINSLHYAQKAIKHQTEKTMRCWVPLVQYICDPKNKQTASRKALENIIGTQKVEILQELDGLPLHHFGIEIDDAPDEEQQAELRQHLFELVKADRLDYSDYFSIKRIFNYKDAQGLLIIKERKKARERDRQQQQALQAEVQRTAVQEQAKAAIAGTMAQGEVQEEMVKAESARWLAQYNRETQLLLQGMKNEIETLKKQLQGEQMLKKQEQKAVLDASRSYTG